MSDKDGPRDLREIVASSNQAWKEAKEYWGLLVFCIEQDREYTRYRREMWQRINQLRKEQRRQLRKRSTE